MIEASANARIAQAMQDAHAERGRAFTHLMKWLFGKTETPLTEVGLTVPSRCA